MQPASLFLLSMKMHSFKPVGLILFFLLLCQALKAQFLMDMIDTSKDVGKGLLAIYKKFDHIRISGYLQPQFQIAGQKGIKTYDGGDFPQEVNNRFMLRRGRIRFEYARFNQQEKPSV